MANGGDDEREVALITILLRDSTLLRNEPSGGGGGKIEWINERAFFRRPDLHAACLAAWLQIYLYVS